MKSIAGGQGVTVVIRNIDYRNTPLDVKIVLDEIGLRGTFAYIYVPKTEVGRNTNVGYAFVRFRKVVYAHECARLFDGEVFGAGATRKLCRIDVASFQDELPVLLRRQSRMPEGDGQNLLVCEDRIPFDDGTSSEGSDAGDSISIDDLPDLPEEEYPPTIFAGARVGLTADFEEHAFIAGVQCGDPSKPPAEASGCRGNANDDDRGGLAETLRRFGLPFPPSAHPRVVVITLDTWQLTSL